VDSGSVRSTRALLDPGLLALIAAVAIWGSSFVVTKVALEEAGPFTILFLRFLVAICVIGPFAWRRGFRPSMVFERRFLGLGFIGILLPFGFHNVGLVYTSAANAALIFATMPGLMAVLSFIVLGERMTVRKVVAVALSIAGVVVIAGTTAAHFGLGTLVGDLLIFGSSFTWSLYTVYSRRTVVGIDPLVATMAAMTAGLIYLVPLTVGEVALLGLPSLTAAGAGAIFFLGACCTGLAIALWNIGLRRIEASVAAPLTSLESVVGVALAALVGETITGGQLAGGAVVIAGAVVGSLEAAPGNGGTVPVTNRGIGQGVE